MAAAAAAAALVTFLVVGGAAAGPERSVLRVDDTTGLVESVNAVRAAHGLEPLRRSTGLNQAALAHSRDMLERGVFAHESADGTSFAHRVRRYYPASGFSGWRVAENILSSSRTLRPDRAVAAWLRSPPHRRTLLDPHLQDIGIAAVFTKSAPGAFRGRQAWVVTLDAGTRRRS